MSKLKFPWKTVWKAVWDEYDEWIHQREEEGKCRSCGRQSDFPEWPEQQEKIQELVQKHVGA